MLNDLSTIISNQENVLKKFNRQNILLTDTFKKQFLTNISSDYTLSFYENYSILTSKKDLDIYIPNQWFYLGYIGAPLVKELLAYKKTLTNNLPSVIHDREDFPNFVTDAKAGRLDPAIWKGISDNLEASDIPLLKQFLTDYKSWYGAKTIDRQDFYVSPVLSLLKLVATSSGYVSSIAYFIAEDSILSSLQPKDMFIVQEEKIYHSLNYEEEFKEWLISMYPEKQSTYFKWISTLNRFINAANSELSFEKTLDLWANPINFVNKYKVTDLKQIAEKMKPNTAYISNSGGSELLSIYKKVIEWTNSLNNNTYNTEKSDYPHQLIFSGAPGTGKSFKLNEMAEKYFNHNGQSTFERITFHPNINYGNFVGVYKPFPSDNKETPIVYEYIPGILLKQLEKAYKNPEINYLVLIEEINRANVAAVFGDTFQLLDRNEKGNSSYPIALSEDLIHYFINKSDIPKDIKENLFNNGLYFPNNLYIWSSMNGADQGVMPIDTAFKRRWDFVKFDPNELSHIEDSVIKKTEEDILNNSFIKLSNQQKISWNLLRKNINNLLLNLNIPEDKLIGPYFIARKHMESGNVTDQFETKVLMYLFEDVVKSNPKRLFEGEDNVLYYSALVDSFKKDGVKIFKNIDTSLVAFNDVSTFDTYNSLQYLISNIENEEKKELINDFDKIIKNNFHNATYTVGDSKQIFVTDQLLLQLAPSSGYNKFMEITKSKFNSNDTELQAIIRLPFNENNNLNDIISKTSSGNHGDFETTLNLKSKQDIERVLPLIEKAFEKTKLLRTK